MFHECDRECKAYTERDHPIPGRWTLEDSEFGEMKFRRCPKSMIDPGINWYLTAFDFYQKGITPNGLGWNREANKYVEAMHYINFKLAEHQKENSANGK